MAFLVVQEINREAWGFLWPVSAGTREERILRRGPGLGTREQASPWPPTGLKADLTRPGPSGTQSQGGPCTAGLGTAKGAAGANAGTLGAGRRQSLARKPPIWRLGQVWRESASNFSSQN